MINNSNFICVAKIIDAYGIKGELKIKSFTQNQEDIFNFKELLDINGIQSYKLKKKSISNKSIIASIDGILDRNKAESLIGTSLYIAKTSLIKIENDNEFYHNDLINMNVLDLQNQKIARVKAIYNFGASDLIEIEYLDGKLEILPFTKKIVPTINIDGNYMVINLPDTI